MKIFYDYQIFSLQSYGGISRYFSEIAARISRFDEARVTLCALAHRNDYLKSHSLNSFVGFYVPHIPKTSKIRQLCNGIATRYYLEKWRPNIIHETYYKAYYPRKTAGNDKSKVVITIHDMIHEKFAECFPPADRVAVLKKAAVSRADHIICVSQNTRNDVLNLYRIGADRVSVVYHGCSLRVRTMGPGSPIIERPFILYVGQRKGHKNFKNLLRAYAASQRLKDAVSLVCFGGGAFDPGEIKMIRDLNLDAAQVIQIFGNDDTLAGLYDRAQAFVYPSLYEGFGIPPIEAMALRCPVVCSNTGSLPEIVGEAAEVFNPYEVEHIMSALERVVFSKSRSDELRRLGLEQAAQFGWDRCSRETYNIYKRL
ncbi:MAG: glycosyltransferase family 1 protein [bacterium]